MAELLIDLLFFLLLTLANMNNIYFIFLYLAVNTLFKYLFWPFFSLLVVIRKQYNLYWYCWDANAVSKDVAAGKCFIKI